jgi:hypothetical protein
MEGYGPLGGKILSCFERIATVAPDTLLWVMLELHVGEVPGLIDTVAQFSCVRSDVAEFLYLRGEPCTPTACSATCFLADERRFDVTDSYFTRETSIIFVGSRI